MTRRQRLTPSERAAIYEQQDGKCSCGCGQPLAGRRLEEDHTQPYWLTKVAKPDALIIYECHLIKSRYDGRRADKDKRMRRVFNSQWHGTNTHKGKLKSRAGGWPKRKMAHPTLKRKFDGTVARRQ